ncbi:MAG TPA: FG-GAP-like repeat-containing protein [Bacteroidales bacterium]
MKKFLFLFVLLIQLCFLPLAGFTQTIFPVPKYPYETCIVDYDLDGDNDLLVGCKMSPEDDTIVFFINDGWGNFEKQQFAANGFGFIYCLDLTNDNYPDIISRDGDSIFFYENNHSIEIGDGHFIRDTYGNPFIGGIADFNMDGTHDILYYDIAGPWGWGVLFNNGDKTFTDTAFVESSETNLYVYSGYINRDNRADILQTTLNQSESVYILNNNYPEFNKMNIASPYWNRGYILNVNSDSLNDVLLVKESYFGSTKIVNMLNKADHFQACDTLVYENGTYIGNVGDYNLDGYDDISMIVYQANNNPIQDSIYIYFNDKNCGYTHSQGVFMGDYFWLATINSGDLNGDGYPELVIQGYSMPTPEHIRILWNDGTGHFIDTNSVYVGEKEIQLQNQVSLYPNPTSGKLVVRSGNQKIKSIQIMDLNGRILFREKYSQSQSYIELDLAQQALVAGLYFCTVQLENEEYVFKKIINTKN